MIGIAGRAEKLACAGCMTERKVQYETFKTTADQTQTIAMNTGIREFLTNCGMHTETRSGEAMNEWLGISPVTLIAIERFS